MKIALFGLGYVGSVCAAALARDGHRVAVVEVSTRRVSALLEGRSPVTEPGLDELIGAAVRDELILGGCSPEEAMRDADISMVTVGTPQRATLSRTCVAAWQCCRQRKRPRTIYGSRRKASGPRSVRSGVSSPARITEHGERGRC